MNQINLGIIGCGVIGNVTIEAAANLKYAKVIAVADLQDEVASQTAAKFGKHSCKTIDNTVVSIS